MRVRLLLILVMASLSACGQQPGLDFEGGLPADAVSEGDVTIQGDQVHAGRGAVRLGKGGLLTIPLRPVDGFGAIEMWIYDSGFQRPGEAAKERSFGGVWGLGNALGEQLVFGLMWAPYLSGNDTYGWLATTAGGWASRRYARTRRSEGWHHWVFTIGNETELSVTCDDQPVTGYDHQTAQFFHGASAVYLRGPQEVDEPLYVDDITAKLQDEPLKARTIPLPGEHWTPPDLPPLPLKAELAGQHPRLFFTAEQIPDIRGRCETTHAKYFEALMGGARSYLEQMPPANAADCANDQVMQQWGWWRLQTLAFAYVCTGDEAFGRKAIEWMSIIASYPHWGTGEEADQSMGSANMLSGMACAYDWCFDLMTDEQRATFRDKLFLQVELQYHKGFADPRTAGYWKSDHQNNHRHHRLCGFVLGALATNGEVEGADRYAAYAAAECRAVAEALPPDGSNHEGPGYTPFGYSYVVRSLDALRHCTGVDLFADTAGLRHIVAFRAHTMLPGFQDVFNFGDCGGGAYYFNHYLMKLAAEYGDGESQAFVDAMYEAEPGSFSYYPWPILWFSAELDPVPLDGITRSRYFDDLEAAFYRTSWTDPNALAVMLKCGPYGGHRLNELAQGYVNVAHDHPDANHFMLCWGGVLWATDDGYPRQNKTPLNHNLILADGQGQAHRGGGWTQPIAGMAGMGQIAGFHHEDGLFWARGDAAAYYKAQNVTVADRWLIVPGDEAVVIVDRLKADQPRTWSWLLHTAAEVAEPEPGHLTLNQGGHVLHLRFLAPVELEVVLAPDVMEGKPRGTLITANFGPASEATFAVVATLDESPAAECGVTADGLALTVGDEAVEVDFAGGGVTR